MSRRDALRAVVATPRSLQKAELDRVAHVLAAAFRDNPLNRAVIASDDRERRLRCNVFGARALLPAALAEQALRLARSGDGQIVAVLIGLEPLRYPLPAPELGSRLRCAWGQGFRVARRWAAVFEELDAWHLSEPHRYLGTLAVDPQHQRRGLGSELLARWLDEMSHASLPVYLETDRCENLAFYERFGFSLLREIQVLGTPIWCMLRPGVGLAAAAGLRGGI